MRIAIIAVCQRRPSAKSRVKSGTQAAVSSPGDQQFLQDEWRQSCDRARSSFNAAHRFVTSLSPGPGTARLVSDRSMLRVPLLPVADFDGGLPREAGS